MARFDAAEVLKTQFSHDKLGRITARTETIAGTTDTFAYSYDPAGRLAEVKKNDVTDSTYAYDTNGNRLSRTAAGATVAGTYDNQDRLTRYGTATYAYTANGELQSKTDGAQKTGYAYDELGNLLSVSLPGGSKIEYLVDGSNRRIGKKLNGVLVQGFLYQDKLKPLVELDDRNNVVSRFVYATRVNVPEYMIKGGVTYRIITDHLGSPRLVVDATTGKVAQRMDYDEFGKVIQDTNPGFQPFGFAGGLYDRDSKLVRFGARDYDAETGRWTAKDPVGFRGRSSNLYGYASNNPISFLDIDGRETIVFIWEGMSAHASVYIGRGQDGIPHLFDPGGSFGQGWHYSDADILSDYRSYWRREKDPIQKEYKFNTTADEEAEIERNFLDNNPSAPGIFTCAMTSSNALSGVGPFKDLRPQFTPGGLGDELRELLGALWRRAFPSGAEGGPGSSNLGGSLGSGGGSGHSY